MDEWQGKLDITQDSRQAIMAMSLQRAKDD